MPTTSQLLVFCFTAVVLILTPGPNFIYILTRGTTQGHRAALFAVVGLGCGVMIHTMLASIGISALIRSSYLLFQIIKYGGSLYLIYLGLQALRHHDPLAPSAYPVSTESQRILWQSIVASMTNPKTTLFFLSFLPQFVNSATSNVTVQLLLLGSIYMVLTILIYGLIAYFAGSIGHGLRTRTVVASRFRWLTGSSFIGLGLWAAFPDRR
jgi:threonine/homoserine/homoserine lactone efflux protein